MGFQAAEGMNIHLMDDEVTELTLLLPRTQVQSLETLAQEKGMSLGSLLRTMVRNVLRNNPSASAPRFD